ncbi:PIN domain-like protein [Marasmius fiardii PR-910]|nr:PIN domain-like protein [Marasmius fiardii PR-910]
MGVKSLWSLLTPVGRPVSLENMEGRTLAIDSSIWIYQFQATMRGKDGNALNNAHVLGFLRRLCKLLFYGMKPVFVFDGGAPALKRSTLNERRKKKSGAAATHAKVAERLLAAQLRREALKHVKGAQSSSKGKGKAGDDETVYLEDLDPHLPRTPAKKKKEPEPTSSSKKPKFYDHDPYRLPEVDMEARVASATRATAPDPRLATEDELRDFIENMRPEDFDVTSPAFRELPTEVQYEIVGDLRLKSRQTSYTRLQQMLRNAPTPLDFSKQQIKNLQQRNALTQQLLTTTDTIGKAHIEIPVRIASERNKEYVLLKNEDASGGWILGIRDDGTEQKPIILDHDNDKDSDEDDDMEEVEIPNQSSGVLAMDPDLREYQRSMALAGTSRSLAPGSSVPFGRDSPVEEVSIPLFMEEDEDDDADLALAIQASLEDRASVDQTSSSFAPGNVRRRVSPDVSAASSTRLQTVLAIANVGTSSSANSFTVATTSSTVPSSSSKSFGQPFLLNHSVVEKPTLPPLKSTQNTPRTAVTSVVSSPRVPELFSDSGKLDTSRTTPVISSSLPQLPANVDDVDTMARDDEIPPPHGYVNEEQQQHLENHDNTPEPSDELIISLDGDLSGPQNHHLQSLNTSRSVLQTNQNLAVNVAYIDHDGDGDLFLRSNSNSPPEIPAAEEVVAVEGLRPPSPEPEAGDWDAAQEMDPTAEEGEFARFVSQVKGRDIDDVRREIDEEIIHLNEQRKNAMRDSEDINQQMITQIMMMLRLFGIPYITAPMEAEAQCAMLASLGLVDGIITDDSDVFLFGGQKVYKNMFNQSKTVECFLSSDLTRELGLDQGTLIRLAYLLGSDYVEGLPGVGPVVAMELLREFPGNDGLHKFKEWWSKVQTGRDKEEDNPSVFRKRFKKKFKDLYLPPEWPNSAVRDAYYHPTVDESEEPFKWGLPDLDALREFLREELGWDQSKVDDLLLPIIQKMNKRSQAAARNRQGNLNGFLDVSGDGGTIAPRKRQAYASKRLQAVVSDFRRKRRSVSSTPTPDNDNDVEDEDGSESRPPTKKSKSSNSSSGRNTKGKTKNIKRASGSNRRRAPVVDEAENSDEGDKFEEPLADREEPPPLVVSLRPRPKPKPTYRTAEAE